jgi:hypothetical protein
MVGVIPEAGRKIMSGFSRRVLAALIVAAALFSAIALTSPSTAHVAAIYCPGGTSWDNILHRCV